MSTRVFTVTGLPSATPVTPGANVIVPPVATPSRKLPAPESFELVTTASANADGAAASAARAAMARASRLTSISRPEKPGEEQEVVGLCQSRGRSARGADDIEGMVGS